MLSDINVIKERHTQNSVEAQSVKVYRIGKELLHRAVKFMDSFFHYFSKVLIGEEFLGRLTGYPLTYTLFTIRNTHWAGSYFFRQGSS